MICACQSAKDSSILLLPDFMQIFHSKRPARSNTPRQRTKSGLGRVYSIHLGDMVIFMKMLFTCSVSQKNGSKMKQLNGEDNRRNFRQKKKQNKTGSFLSSKLLPVLAKTKSFLLLSSYIDRI